MLKIRRWSLFNNSPWKLKNRLIARTSQCDLRAASSSCAFTTRVPLLLQYFFSQVSSGSTLRWMEFANLGQLALIKMYLAFFNRFLLSYATMHLAVHVAMQFMSDTASSTWLSNWCASRSESTEGLPYVPSLDHLIPRDVLSSTLVTWTSLLKQCSLASFLYVYSVIFLIKIITCNDDKKSLYTPSTNSNVYDFNCWSSLGKLTHKLESVTFFVIAKQWIPLESQMLGENVETGFGTKDDW